jgi:hypothetical protein
VSPKCVGQCVAEFVVAALEVKQTGRQSRTAPHDQRDAHVAAMKRFCDTTPRIVSDITTRGLEKEDAGEQ